MRRVSRLVVNTNRDTRFSQSVKQIAAEKARHPTEYRDYELNAILRKEQALAKSGQTVKSDRNLTEFDLLRAITWKHSPRDA